MKSIKKKEYCIVENINIDENELSSNDVVKVFYKDKYINKYSKIIDKDKSYSKIEANEILKTNSTYGFVVSTKDEYNNGLDMIKELAYLEERAELNFEVLCWKSIEDFVKKINKEGYSTEKITEEEFEKWFKHKYPKIKLNNK